MTVTANGTGELVGVVIKSGEFDGTDPDDLSDLVRPDRGRLPRRQGPGRRPGRRALGPLAGGLGGRTAAACPAPRARAGRVMYEGVVQDLIDELGRLPGVGPKSAQRIAFHLLQADPTDVRRLAEVLIEVKAEGDVLLDVLQRRRGRAVPDLPRPAA